MPGESKTPSATVTEAQERRAARGLRTVIWIVIVLALLGSAALLLRSRWSGRTNAATEAPVTTKSETPKDAPERVQFSAEALSRAAIETQAVSEQSLPLELEATGRIQVNEDASARVGSPTEGRVARVLVTVGDYVKAGQPVVFVHSHELVQALADHSKALSRVTRAEKTLAFAQAELERINRLQAIGAVSQREQRQAAAEITAATSELEQARTEQRRTEEFLEHLGVTPENSEYAVIRAPIAGVVTKRNVSIGTVVNPAEDLLVIANLSTLWAVAEVPEKDAGLVRPGQPVWLTVQAFPDKHFAGRVVHIGESLNPETRTTQVRCLIENARGQLRPEMYAAIHLSTGRTAPLLAVPREAVQEMQGQRVVFVAVSDSSFEKRVVQTGREQGTQVEITSGLHKGERIVTRGGFFIKSEFLKGAMSEE
jgi:cobalt-zinc-cadmium efflux system membrane fusion protein